MVLPEPLIAIHRRLNRGTRGAWERYRDHRERAMRLLEGGGKAIAVLGAGNCNDVDLEQLARDFAEVHLLDVDVEALSRVPSANSSLHTHEADLAGFLPHLASWRVSPPNAEALRALPDTAARDVAASVGQRFDVVLSSLVLSQIVHTAMEVLGRTHPALAAISVAGVVAHLRIALALLERSSDARLVLLVDTLARPTPELKRALREHRSPDELLVQMDAAGLCLPGTSVSFLTHALSKLAPDAELELIPAWTWAPSAARTHLVHGLVVHVGRRTPR